jgi:hypothetical protein
LHWLEGPSVAHALGKTDGLPSISALQLMQGVLPLVAGRDVSERLAMPFLSAPLWPVGTPFRFCPGLQLVGCHL